MLEKYVINDIDVVKQWCFTKKYMSNDIYISNFISSYVSMKKMLNDIT